jgi:hypothetical protein
LEGSLVCTNTQDGKLRLLLQFYEGGLLRLLVDSPAERRLRTSKYFVTEDGLAPAQDMVVDMNEKAGECTVKCKLQVKETDFDTYESSGACKYVIRFNPFTIEGYFDERLAFVLNRRQLFNFEQYRTKESMLVHAKDTTDVLAALHGWKQTELTDTLPCPKGPSSVALDCSFCIAST